MEEPGKSCLSVMFTTGRTLSTVVEKSIRQLKGGKVYHEPWNFKNMKFLSLDATQPTGSRWERDPNRTHRDVTNAMAQDAAGGLYEFLFVKEAIGPKRGMLAHLKEELLHPILKRANIIFLIRHPYKVLPSVHKAIAKRDDEKATEYFSKDLLDLYNFVESTLGYAPVIFDADDVEGNPEAAMRAIYHASGIEFESSMMNWKSEPFAACSKTTFHHAIVNSTGFKTKDAELVAAGRERKSIEGLPSWLIKVMDVDLPYYMQLYNRRENITE